MLIKSPCKGCGKRTPTCHGTCGLYLTYRQELDAYNAAKIEQANKNDVAILRRRQLKDAWLRKKAKR